jgi:hypothetical protein
MEGVNPMTYGLQKKGNNTMQTNLLRRDPILEECTDGKDLTNLFKITLYCLLQEQMTQADIHC